MIGVKLAHAHQHMRYDDAAYWSIYDLAAEANAPVYLHTGSSPFPGIQTQAPYTDPAYLRPAIIVHPDTVFILGHLGHDFLNKQIGELQTCIDLALEFPNLYLEPSAPPATATSARPTAAPRCRASWSLTSRGMCSRPT